MGFCCFIIPIPFVVALLCVLASSLLLPSGAPILSVAAQQPWTRCGPDQPLVNCLLDPCKTTSAGQCPLGCRADYCGGCNAHCLCRNRLDCLASGGDCKKEEGELVGTCLSFAPPKQPGDTGAPKTTYIDVPVNAPSSVEVPADAEPAVPAEPAEDVAEPAAAESSVASRAAVILTDDVAPVQSCRMWCGPGKVCRQGQCVRANPRFPVQRPPQEDKCALMRCASGTRCVDGRCEAPSCASNADCSSEQGLYCSSKRKCVLQGSCSVPADCASDPSFVHPMCVGTFTCSAQRCGYTCNRG